MKEYWLIKLREAVAGENNKQILLVVIGVLGVLLIAAGGQKSKSVQTQVQPNKTDEHLEYVLQMEQKIETILSKIQGVGKVRVGLALEAGAETIYAKDVRIDRAGQHNESKHVFMKQKGSDSALIETTAEPIVRGVAVVCEGAGQIEVDAQIIEVVSVLTGVTTNRISIAKMS